jgi:hypothetical protein
MSQIKFENWSPGIKSGTVICDTPIGGDHGHDDVEYYGGHLVAESIPKKEWVQAIAALPELLEACILAEYAFRVPSDMRLAEQLTALAGMRSAIAKIGGRTK